MNSIPMRKENLHSTLIWTRLMRKTSTLLFDSTWHCIVPLWSARVNGLFIVIVRVKICSFSVSFKTLLFNNIDDGIWVDENKLRWGKFSVPGNNDDDTGDSGNEDGGTIARLFDDEGASLGLNVERTIDTEHETNEEPLLSSLVWALWICKEDTMQK